MEHTHLDLERLSMILAALRRDPRNASHQSPLHSVTPSGYLAGPRLLVGGPVFDAQTTLDIEAGVSLPDKRLFVNGLAPINNTASG